MLPHSKRILFSKVIVIVFFINFFGVEICRAHDEKFNAGEVIIEHILDAHEWEIVRTSSFKLSVPLPVILYYERQLEIFMSSKITDGKEYKGFTIMTEPPHKGKIVKIRHNADGTKHADPKLPVDFSITKNVVAVFFSSLMMLLLFLVVAKAYKKSKTAPPKGITRFVEPFIIFVKKEIVKGNMSDYQAEKTLPYLLTLFFFILINNIFGIIPVFPFGANLSGNITFTLCLAIFTFFMTLLSSNKHYWTDIFNTPDTPWWVKIPIPLLPVVEFIGIFTKPIVLAIRLFANMSAGHIIVLGFTSLIFILGELNFAAGIGIAPVSVIFIVFISLLEILVAFIQAFVFTLLSAIYIGMASYKPEYKEK